MLRLKRMIAQGGRRSSRRRSSAVKAMPPMPTPKRREVRNSGMRTSRLLQPVLKGRQERQRGEWSYPVDVHLAQFLQSELFGAREKQHLSLPRAFPFVASED